MVVLVSAPILAGCDHAPRADPVAQTTTTGSPGELLGAWQSTGAGDALLMYRFDADGGYTHTSVLVRQRPSGLFSQGVRVSGSVDVDGERLVLRPEDGAVTLTDPGSPGSSYTNRPMTDLSAAEYTWMLSPDGDLGLTEAASGKTVTYRRL